jgi:hypothetical protein
MIEDKYAEYLPYGDLFNIEKLLEFASMEIANDLIAKIQVSENDALAFVDELGLKLVVIE